MKSKLVYLYAGLIIALVLFLILSDNNSKIVATKSTVNPSLSNNNAHPQMGDPVKTKPGKENVNKNVFHKLEKFKKAIDKNPKDTLMIRKYAELLSMSHKSKEAIKYYNMILKIDPKRTDILFELSFIHFSRMNFNEALRATKNILKINPNNIKAYYNLGAIYASKGNKLKARNIWNDIVKNNSSTEEAKLSVESLKKLN